jgi:hypothetical protein
MNAADLLRLHNFIAALNELVEGTGLHLEGNPVVVDEDGKGMGELHCTAADIIWYES